MGRYNKGTIFTNNSCIGCNRCIAYCKNMGANVSLLNDDVTQIQVDSKKCSDCGVCIGACLHGAREYRDDCEFFISALEKGEKISLIVSSTFYVIYKEEAKKILGCLKEMGVEKIYDMSFGSEISLWATCKYLKENEEVPNNEKAFISPICPALVNEVEMNHPKLLRKLIPVQSPMMCMAIYAKKYLNDSNKLAFLGPCIAAKDEIASEGKVYDLEYNLTFSHLMKYLRLNKKLNKCKTAKADLTARSFGNIIPMIEGFKECASCFFDRTKRLDSYWNLSNETYEILEMSDVEDGRSAQPLFTEVFACGNGCQEGPAVEPGRSNACELYAECTELREESIKAYDPNVPPHVNWQRFEELFKDVKDGDFVRFYTDKFRQGFHVPDNTYEEIFESMLKDTSEKQNINCGSCGYNTCKDMATAIAYGYNRKENCIHYMNDNVRRNAMFSRVAGLYNENMFVQLARRILDENPDKRYTVSYADINKLNLINDVYGFDKGDIVLQRIGDYVKEVVAGDRGVACYIGAGAYVVLAEYNPRIVSILSKEDAFDFSDADIRNRITMHIGLYFVEDNSENVRSMINFAQMASKQTSSLIHHTVSVFSPEKRDALREETDISSQMIKAVDNNEFVLWYQPQFNTSDSAVSGGEALCRWIKPDGTVVMPDLFIPIAEKNGFIRTLDRQIWEMAFATIRQWLDNGITPPPISLNISRLSLETDEFIQYIVELRDRYKIANHYVRFEITEGVYFGNQDEMMSNITKLRKLGYKIVMDDFGSGYSSLNSLKDMPIDILKLDMGFLKSEMNMDRGGTIISAVARMAQDLELITVAEGVETQTQANFLMSVGINNMQGFLFAKPMTGREFAELIQTNKVPETETKPEAYAKLDVGKFFDPASYESMMFESFARPAGLIEYNDSTDAVSVVRANKGGLEVLGCENKPFIEVQKVFDRYMNSKRGLGVLEIIRKSIEKEEKLSATFKLREQKYMSEVWLKIDVNEISRRGDRHIIFLSIENVTDEKIVENMLDLSNRQLAFMLNTERIGSCLFHVVVDEDKSFEKLKGEVLRANTIFAEDIGYAMDEILSWTEKDLLSIIHPLDKKQFINNLLSSLTDEKASAFEHNYRVLNKSGYYLHVRMILTATHLEDNSYMVTASFINQADKT